MEAPHHRAGEHEALGGELCGERQTQIAGIRLPLVAYGWANTASLSGSNGTLVIRLADTHRSGMLLTGMLLTGMLLIGSHVGSHEWCV